MVFRENSTERLKRKRKKKGKKIHGDEDDYVEEETEWENMK